MGGGFRHLTERTRALSARRCGTRLCWRCSGRSPSEPPIAALLELAGAWGVRVEGLANEAHCAKALGGCEPQPGTTGRDEFGLSLYGLLGWDAV